LGAGCQTTSRKYNTAVKPQLLSNSEELKKFSSLI
jgi:hypothetical protein